MALKSSIAFTVDGIELQNDMQNCYNHGASGYVVKPSGLEELETTMRHIVDFWCQANSLPPAFRDGRFSAQGAN